MTLVDAVYVVGLLLVAIFVWPIFDQRRCPYCLGKRRRCEPCGGWDCTRCGTHQEKRP